MIGKKQPQSQVENRRKKLIGKRRNKKQRQKYRLSKMGDKNPMSGKCGELHHNAKKYEIEHSDGQIDVAISLTNYANCNDYQQANLWKVKNGERKRHKDIIRVAEIL